MSDRKPLSTLDPRWRGLVIAAMVRHLETFLRAYPAPPPPGTHSWHVRVGPFEWLKPEAAGAAPGWMALGDDALESPSITSIVVELGKRTTEPGALSIAAIARLLGLEPSEVEQFVREYGKSPDLPLVNVGRGVRRL